MSSLQGGLNLPTILQKNPITEAGFQLGRHLFYDPFLSRDSTISCASCHLQATGFTHVDHKLSHGIDGRIGTRNSPAIMNMAWSSSFMWDGGVNHLDMQPINPITRLQTPIVLSANEKVDLVAFLLTLTDRDFLFDPRFGYPRE